MRIKVKNIFKCRVIALLLLATGYGWSGGHFIPVTVSLLAYLFQLGIILLIILLSLSFFSTPDVQKHSKPTIGITIFASLSLIINIANIIHGVINTNDHLFGSHNTIPDLIPIGILILGNTLWLLTLFPFKKLISDRT